MSDSASDVATAAELEIKNILLVDDDIELANTLKDLLESRNFVVTTVQDGVDGLREVMGMDYDVIICDMLMPKMPGDMFYLAVQKVRPHMCRRFLFVTGYGDNPKVEAFLKKVDGFVIAKPVFTEDLVRMISLVMKQAAQPLVAGGSPAGQ